MVSFLGVKALTILNPSQPEKGLKPAIFRIFKFSRNPMYRGTLIGLAGLTLYFGDGLLFLSDLFFFIYRTRFQIKTKEKY